MTEDISICIDPSTFVTTPHGTITGGVILRIGNECFPMAGWTDFPLIIFNQWLEPAPRVLSGDADLWKCQFWDGPFSFELTRKHEDTWRFTASRDGRGFGDRNNKGEMLQTEVSCHAFINALLKASSEALRSCFQRGWNPNDANLLQSKVKAISQLLGRDSIEIQC